MHTDHRDARTIWTRPDGVMCLVPDHEAARRLAMKQPAVRRSRFAVALSCFAPSRIRVSAFGFNR